MKAPLSALNAVIAISAGVIVLLGYFVPGLDFLRDLVLHWALVLAAFALIVGVVNLLSTHGQKVAARKPAAFYSLVLILAFAVTAIVVALPLPGLTGPESYWAQWLMRYVQIPIEGSLLAILAVTLAVAVVRLLRRRPDGMVLIFVATVVIVLLGSVPFYTQGEPTVFSGLRTWISTWLGTAGVRGLLIGIALGTVAAGLRVLMGVDRPYGG